MRKILQSRTFERQIKKIHKSDKKKIDETVIKTMKAPEKGDPKKGNLAGIYTMTFGLHGAQHRLAYRYDAEKIELLSFGPREIFYR
jgi:mRNA interferase RelE/StbE